MKTSYTKLNQAGDTLIEVLIALMIVSSVLGSAFVVVNRSTQNVRNAQEHEEALGLVQAQVERLKVAAKDTDPTVQAAIFSSAAPFCVKDAGDIVATSDPECAQGADSRYKLSIQRSGNVFQFYGNWDGVGGQAQQVNIVYELFQ